MKRLWLLSRLSSTRSTRFNGSSILPTDVQSEFSLYDLDFFLKNFSVQGFAAVAKEY